MSRGYAVRDLPTRASQISPYKAPNDESQRGKDPTNIQRPLLSQKVNDRRYV